MTSAQYLPMDKLMALKEANNEVMGVFAFQQFLRVFRRKSNPNIPSEISLAEVMFATMFRFVFDEVIASEK